jgi:hypothetical protein
MNITSAPPYNLMACCSRLTIGIFAGSKWLKSLNSSSVNNISAKLEPGLQVEREVRQPATLKSTCSSRDPVDSSTVPV